MAPGRSSKTLANRRRRTQGDDEDDDSVTMADDTQSEPSVASDLDDDDDDGDADASDPSDTDTTEPMIPDVAVESSNSVDKDVVSLSKRRRKTKKSQEQRHVDQGSAFTDSVDTETMLHGLKIDADDAPTVDFEDMAAPDTERSSSGAQPAGRGPVGVADRRRREHEEYKKKRNTDPTFIPNRGGFFMHDARIPEQRGFSSFARGRGRGRGLAPAPLSSTPYVYPCISHAASH